MSNLKQISENLGVSVETVSRVLNGKYQGRTKKSRATMRLIKKEAERVGYKPSTAARAMRTQSTGLIGVVVEEGALRTHPVFTEILHGADAVLKEAGYVLTISSLTGIEASTLSSRVFTEHLLDGLMVFDSSNDDSAKSILKKVPNSILVNSSHWQPTCCLRRDEFAAGQIAGKELKELGYRKAFYFEPNCGTHYSIASRIDGFSDAFAGAGQQIERVSAGTGAILDWLRANRSKLTPDCVLVASENLRLFCLTSALSQMDLEIGSDCGLASLDDETGLLASFPNVSRVTFPRIDIGRAAGEMMVALLAGQQDRCKSVEFKGEWFSGATTRSISI